MPVDRFVLNRQFVFSVLRSVGLCRECRTEFFGWVRKLLWTGKSADVGTRNCELHLVGVWAKFDCSDSICDSHWTQCGFCRQRVPSMALWIRAGAVRRVAPVKFFMFVLERLDLDGGFSLQGGFESLDFGFRLA